VEFWLATIIQGLVFAIMALGVFITYKILDFPDLSVEGTFPLGASITAALIVKGVNPIVSIIFAFIGGAIAGFCTGFLNIKMKISNLLAGILVMTGLYSINLRVMGKSNIHLFEYKTIFDGFLPPIALLLIIVILIKIGMDLLLKTQFGVSLKALGDNPQLVRSLGISEDKIKFYGLMLSNGLVCVSGAIYAQMQSFSDVGMGAGIIVAGLASIIFGISIFKKIKFMKFTTMAILGSLLYRLCIGVALKLGLPAGDLKLVTVIIISLAIGLKINPKKFRLKKLSFNKKINLVSRREGEVNA